jgi:hypothetical protein
MIASRLLPLLLALGLSRAQNGIVNCDGDEPVDWDACMWMGHGIAHID